MYASVMAFEFRDLRSLRPELPGLTDSSGQNLDKRRLYGTFMFEVTIYFLPHILGAALAVPTTLSFAFSNNVLGGMFAGLIVAAAGLGITIKGFYSFPALSDPGWML
jgi:uncharacterized membrane protein